MERISQKKYKEQFKLQDGATDPQSKLTENALARALDTRKFEISLYWERAKYFWTFIAAALVAFGVTQRLNEKYNEELLSVLISCLGLLFSLAWYLVNRGSKRWQENWENHVALLEDGINGPLFKTILSRCDRHALIGPARYSVSKINQIVSLCVTFFWLALLIYSEARVLEFSIELTAWKHIMPIGFGVLTLGGCLWLVLGGKSDDNEDKGKPADFVDHQLRGMQRKAEIGCDKHK